MMPTQPSQSLRGTPREDTRRTIFAFVSAAIISAAMLALLLIFDVR